MPDCKSPRISFGVVVLSLSCVLAVSQGVRLCRLQAPVVDINPAEELKAAC